MAESRVRIRCTYCHDSVEREQVVHCAACLAPHHEECQREHGRCAAPGCDDGRVLVADPEGRPPRPLSPRPTKKVQRGRLLAYAAAAAVVAAGVIGWALAPARADAAKTDAPVARVPLRVLERAAGDVALAARDFRLPVSLREGERLVVSTGERGYTHVVLEREGRAPEDRFVAEPGDPVVVVVADVSGPERLRVEPGTSIVLERAPNERVRVLVLAD